MSRKTWIFLEKWSSETKSDLRPFGPRARAHIGFNLGSMLGCFLSYSHFPNWNLSRYDRIPQGRSVIQKPQALGCHGSIRRNFDGIQHHLSWIFPKRSSKLHYKSITDILFCSNNWFAKNAVWSGFLDHRHCWSTAAGQCQRFHEQHNC